MKPIQSLFRQAKETLFVGKARFQSALPLKGFQQQLLKTPFVDPLSDADLIELNTLLKWKCFTVDRKGRRFGNAAWKGKRCEPQIIPDRRILLMHERFDLTTKHVLEVGCFEGIHTIGLSQYARKVTAIDSRMENVVKTIVRCAFFGVHPTVFKCNLEEQSINTDLIAADVAHHVGVLYHLKNPVQHLLNLGQHIRLGVLLDTHYALENEANESLTANGKTYRYKRYKEAGHEDVFSGMYDHSKWLTIDDIVAILKGSGFKNVEIVETRNERNGPRILMIAQKSQEMIQR